MALKCNGVGYAPNPNQRTETRSSVVSCWWCIFPTRSRAAQRRVFVGQWRGASGSGALAASGDESERLPALQGYYP